MTARPDLGGALVAAGFLGIGVYAVWTSLGMTMLGAIFPRTIGGVLIALSAIQIGLALVGRGGQASGEGGAEGGGSVVRRVALVVVMVAWAVLFPGIGFVATSVVAGLALLVIAEHERPSPGGRLLRAAIVVAMVGAFYWLMVRVLYIPMPLGLLF